MLIDIVFGTYQSLLNLVLVSKFNNDYISKSYLKWDKITGQNLANYFTVLDDSVFDTTRSFPMNPGADENCLWVNGNFGLLIFNVTFKKCFWQSSSIIKFNGIYTLNSRNGVSSLNAEGDKNGNTTIGYFCLTTYDSIWLACHKTNSQSPEGGHFIFVLPFFFRFV